MLNDRIYTIYHVLNNYCKLLNFYLIRFNWLILNVNTVHQNNRSECIKWLFIAILLIVTIVGNYFYHDVHAPVIRILFILITLIIAGIILLTTRKGKQFILFALEAKNEIRKVIWPTYQETLYTTLIVIVVTAVMSLILWGLDSILVRIVAFIANLRL